MRKLTRNDIASFSRAVYDHYERYGRRDLPWRLTNDPYRILVSEVMLQQTPVRRVLEKYGPFLAAFPDVSSLNRAPLRDVVTIWSGLGYNRRALSLKRAAGDIMSRYGGELPRSFEGLLSLPGIGKATAGAVCAFAYGQPHPFIETNIRTVFIYSFFPRRRRVDDSDILALVELTLDRDDPRTWYYALMDYGVALKKRCRNPSRRSAHYAKQGRFEGSDRQARGKIIRALTGESLGEGELARRTGISAELLMRNIAGLERDGLVVHRRGRFCIPR